MTGDPVLSRLRPGGPARAKRCLVDILENVGRFVAFALLLYMMGFVTSKLISASQREYLRGRHGLRRALAFAQTAVWWLGLFIAMWPITGSMTVALLLVALLIPVVELTSNTVMPKLLRVKRDVKSSIVTATELADYRHPWLAQSAQTAQSLIVPALLLAGILVVVLQPADRQDTMFQLVFGAVFLLMLPQVIRKALVMTQAVLDDNSRDAYLAAGFTAVVVQIIVLGLLLSSLDVPRTDIPLGIADASLSVSLPILGFVIAFFLLGTVVPYAVGITAAQRLRTGYTTEEKALRHDLTQLLIVPKAEHYERGLASIRGRIEAAAADLKDNYFYVSLRRPTSEATTDALATAIDEGSLGSAAATPPRASSDETDILPEGSVDFSRVEALLSRGRRRIERGRGSAVEAEMLGTDTNATDDDLTYGEVLRAVADRRGWHEGDLRLGALRTLAHSFEHDARYADPALVHSAWLDRMHNRVDEVTADLAGRETKEQREQAAQLWSNAVQREEIELEREAASRGGKPGGIILVTTLAGLAATAVTRALTAEVWSLFSGA